MRVLRHESCSSRHIAQPAPPLPSGWSCRCSASCAPFRRLKNRQNPRDDGRVTALPRGFQDRSNFPRCSRLRHQKERLVGFLRSMSISAPRGGRREGAFPGCRRGDAKRGCSAEINSSVRWHAEIRSFLSSLWVIPRSASRFSRRQSGIQHSRLKLFYRVLQRR